MLGILHGDFGNSYRSGQPVFDEIFARFPVTLKLAGLSILVVTVFGILFGILSAVKQHSILDYTMTVLSMLAASIPAFWLGLMMMLLFASHLGILPSYGVEDGWRSYIMPVIALSLPPMAELTRMTRSAMLETIGQDYIRTARAKGLRERAVIWHHALKNALMPIITVIGSNFGSLLGGAVVIETVFSLPGLGSLIVTSIRSKDVPQVMAGTLFIALIFCLVLLVVDVKNNMNTSTNATLGVTMTGLTGTYAQATANKDTGLKAGDIITITLKNDAADVAGGRTITLTGAKYLDGTDSGASTISVDALTKGNSVTYSLVVTGAVSFRVA